MLLLLGLLVACLGPDNYGARAVAITCERQEECFQALFDEQWGSLDECREQLAAQTEAYFECLADNCTFDDEAARTCLDWARSVDCAEMYTSTEPACARVFIDCAPAATTECVLTDGD